MPERPPEREPTPRRRPGWRDRPRRPRLAARVPAAAGVALLLAAPAAGGQEMPDHAPFTELLGEIVVDSLVDYEALMERTELLDRYVASLGRTSPGALEAAPRDEQLAFWLNAYNACMLALVADHYPIEAGGTGLFQTLRNWVTDRPANSVWQIPGVFDRPFCEVAGEERSLDEIEHEIIRPVYQEPRIHFAVNCAAFSCPQLREEAYVGPRLDAQLDEQVERFIADARHFRLRPGSPPVLRVNRVLDWFSEDFGGVDGIPGFFAPYLSGAQRQRILRDDLRVEFFDYDWTLNDVHAEPGG